MKPEEAKAALVRAVHRAWPNAAKASELPFPDYWKAVTEWLTFHAPRIGDNLAEEYIINIIEKAKVAESHGLEPKPWIVPEQVKAIWKKVRRAEPASQDGAAKADEKREAWDHAAERAAAVKDRFAAKAQGRFL